MKKIVLGGIRFYKKYLNIDSPILRGLFVVDKACRFRPTCADYTYQAVEKYGVVKGLEKGFLRVVRCHPWSRGGWDPVK
jgi:uncharacterized protein